MRDNISITFEQTIGLLLQAAGVAITSTPADRTRVDYVFRAASGENIAIEVKGYGFEGNRNQFQQLARAFDPISGRFAKLILITPFEPTAKKLKAFHTAFKDRPNAEWLSAKQFIRSLGMDEFDINDSAKYLSHWYLHQTDRTFEDVGNIWIQEPAPKTPTLTQTDLARQLPPGVLRHLRGSAKPPENFLRIGERVSAVVVLSDLKNFSLLVKAAKPDDLNDAMSKYYRLARELVWSYGGVLDKFIGDAVLAIFNYPSPNETAHINAVKFAVDLTEIGKPILETLKDSINEAIETGTRIGVSSGELSVLNIGLRRIELSFVGDVINLAARLEHESEVDGCLIDNLTKVAISKADSGFLRRLSLVKKTLDHDKMKGQLTSIQAWQVPSSVVPIISDLKRKLPRV
jgi:adenylate cyclase